MDSEQRVAEIRERAEAATEGPWEVEDKLVWEGEYRQPSALVAKTRPDVEGGSNAQFIAAAREDIPWLLDRLRATEAELAAEKDARDEVQENIAYLRRNCMGLPEQELRQKIGAVDSAEWKRGYYWNELVAEHSQRATRAEFAQTAAEARAAEAEAVIAEAPHTAACDSDIVLINGTRLQCDCWKSTAPSAALARVKAEAWDACRQAEFDINGGDDRLDDELNAANPYQAGADQ